MNENFDRQNHLPQQIILPLPLITKNPLMNPQSFQTGGRGRKSIFAIFGVSMQGNYENTRAHCVCLN